MLCWTGRDETGSGGFDTDWMCASLLASSRVFSRLLASSRVFSRLLAYRVLLEDKTMLGGGLCRGGRLVPALGLVACAVCSSVVWPGVAYSSCRKQCEAVTELVRQAVRVTDLDGPEFHEKKEQIRDTIEANADCVPDRGEGPFPFCQADPLAKLLTSLSTVFFTNGGLPGLFCVGKHGPVCIGDSRNRAPGDLAKQIQKGNVSIARTQVEQYPALIKLVGWLQDPDHQLLPDSMLQN